MRGRYLEIAQGSLQMTFGYYRKLAFHVVLWALLGSCASAQTARHERAGTAVLQGHVRDSSGRSVADARVLLRRLDEGAKATAAGESQATHTDSGGAFQFSSVREGAYTLRAELKGSDLAQACVAVVDSLRLARNETKTVDLVLNPDSAEAHKSAQPEFFDEPQFTVAGITQAGNSGGHGSDVVLRNSEELVRATASLGYGAGELAGATSTTSDPVRVSERKAQRASIQARLVPDKADDEHVRQEQSELHHQLARIDEELDDPLAAVQEYQRAAELAPSEAHLFDWASELLIHRALEPATDIFSEGNRLYAKSVRMLIGLGVTWYARGSYDRAAQYLGSASDLDSADQTPYLFMGRMQSVETVPSPETVQRLARFQRLQPENALANYYYAVSLWKSRQAAGALDEASSAQVERLLQAAVRLDPKAGEAYLQLGTLYAQRGDYLRAIPAYLKAIEVSPELQETHYRLAQAYRRTGDEEQARKQMQLHEELSKRAKEQAASERSRIQQFVVSLRDR